MESSGVTGRTLGDFSEGRDNNLTLMRLVAAMAVLLGHCWPLVIGGHTADPVSMFLIKYWPFQSPVHGIGVQVFFVLSGFLIAKSADGRGSIGAFAIARILRIYPLVIATACVLVFVGGPYFTTLSKEEYFSRPETWRFLRENILLLRYECTLPGVFENNPWSCVNGSLWTLPAELRSYLLTAILFALGILGNRVVFNVVALGMLVLYSLTGANPPGFQPDHLHLVIFFLFGGVFYVNRDFVRFTPGAAIAALVTCVLAYSTPAYSIVSGLTLTYFVLWLAYDPRLRLPSLDRLGDASFGVYLFAYPVQQIIIEVTGTKSPWVVFGIAAPVVLVLGFISWYLIERPCLGLKEPIGALFRVNKPKPPQPSASQPPPVVSGAES
jgi:peptidoglycan/LPS O-acetylase OafA/YrhL